VTSPSFEPVPGGSARRPVVDVRTLWAGGLATAVVAALAYTVGIVVVRVVFGVPVLAADADGALGDSTTWQLAMTAFVAALLATALVQVLLAVTPRPYAFFGWIMGLVTVLCTIGPFAQDAPLSSQIATAAITLIVGLTVTSLVRGVAGRAVRPAGRPSPHGAPPPGQPGPHPPLPTTRRGDPYGQR
jgi:hypothetical protein